MATTCIKHVHYLMLFGTEYYGFEGKSRANLVDSRSANGKCDSDLLTVFDGFFSWFSTA